MWVYKRKTFNGNIKFRMSFPLETKKKNKTFKKVYRLKFLLLGLFRKESEP